jgi:hypothetical protein
MEGELRWHVIDIPFQYCERLNAPTMTDKETRWLLNSTFTTWKNNTVLVYKSLTMSMQRPHLVTVLVPAHFAFISAKLFCVATVAFEYIVPAVCRRSQLYMPFTSAKVRFVEVSLNSKLFVVCDILAKPEQFSNDFPGILLQIPNRKIMIEPNRRHGTTIIIAYCKVY